MLIQDDWLEGMFGPLDPDTEDKIKITGLAKDAWSKEMTKDLDDEDDVYEVIWRSPTQIAPLQT